MNNSYGDMANLTSVIGCIVDEWEKGGEPITLDELKHIYSDASKILAKMEIEN